MTPLDNLVYATALLFFIFDPFASLPIFIGMTKGFDDKEKLKSANNAIVVAAILFVIFTLIGTNLLSLFGVSVDSFRVAGGIVLILMAVEIIFGLNLTKQGDSNVAWVIIATPILTGPGVITTAILLVSSVGIITTLLAGVISLAITWALLRNAVYIVRRVGNNVIEIFSKIIGLLIAAMAVEYILRGVADWIGSNMHAVILPSLHLVGL
jgi:multiple antibiotic resistance protein